ncbi:MULTISPECIES: AAA family ATPase [unclassified Microbacterium]|uniref:AAA family ATPase n=1 Tax=unclassified Microbacterium TaxID=2609290 RepID=UPI0016055290|nr:MULTISPECIES: AAA family ATPase [unclassified Microbacterium]QNA91529.1 AAA family ATPase [Microbacterium sp. Se63.02b]QYM64704.1 AAA family ATPase [Microbacterium sp. Se5.02b]
MPPSAPSAEMVGRAAELAEVRRLFAGVRDGMPAALLVEGEAGIGKSRLLREFAAGIEQTADVHAGWCLDLGAARTPYGPLTGILRSIVARMGVDRVHESVGVGAEALGMLLPELVDAPADRDRTSPERLRDAIASLIEAAAERAPRCSSSKTCTGRMSRLSPSSPSCCGRSGAGASCCSSPAAPTTCAEETR